MIHVLQWWRQLWRLAEHRRDTSVVRRSPAAAGRPARCAGDLAGVAERLLAGWHETHVEDLGTGLRTLAVAVLAFSDQLAAEDREQGGGTVWAGDAIVAAEYAAALGEAGDLLPDRNLAVKFAVLVAGGLWELYGWLTERECGAEVYRP